MTVQDMICLAELWITLSEPVAGQMVEKLTLPGELTGRPADRTFKCTLRGSARHWNIEEDWKEYLRHAIDHIDFAETV